MKICPPFGPAAGPASASRSACKSSGSSDSMSRSASLRISAPAFFEGSVSTCCVSATVTTCLSASTLSFASKVSARPAATSMSVFSTSVKPVAIMRTVYLPAGRPAMAKAPLLSVSATFTTLFAPVTVTVAFGTKAPEGSYTVPRTLPVGWAHSAALKRSAREVIQTTRFNFIQIP